MQQLHFGVEAGHFKGRLASVGRWLHISHGNRQVGPTCQGRDNGGPPLQGSVYRCRAVTIEVVMYNGASDDSCCCWYFLMHKEIIRKRMELLL